VTLDCWRIDVDEPGLVNAIAQEYLEWTRCRANLMTDGIDPEAPVERPSAESGRPRRRPQSGARAGDFVTRKHLGGLKALPTMALSGTHPQENERPLVEPVAPAPPAIPALDELAALELEAFIRRTVARGAPSADTIAGYLREARLFRDRFLAPRGISIREVRPRDIEAYRRELVEAGYTSLTIGAKLTALRRLLAAAVEAGLLLANPAEGIGAPGDRREPGAAAERALTLQETQRLICAVAGAHAMAARDRALIALFAGQGLRTIEVWRANLADLNLDAGELMVRGKRRDRRVHLRADVVALLRVWLVLRPDAAPDQSLFVGFGSTCRGLRLSRRGIRGVLARAFAAAGLVPPALSEPRRDGSRRPLRRAALGLAARRARGVRVPSAHGLRATYITLARAGGAELEAIADDVGHADIRMTRRYLDRSRRKANNSALRIPVDFSARDT
jgi:site-specific recombinase XerC